MSTNGTAAGRVKKCPVCLEPFSTGAKLPKVFGVCGHSVCASCVPGCIRCPPGLQAKATCPLCRQHTPLPRKGLPTNYDVELSTTANVKCSKCGKNEQASEAFACKTCTVSQKQLVLVCGACGLRAHKAHVVVEFDALAKAVDIASVMQDERQHNDAVQMNINELTTSIANEMQRISKDCQVDVDVNRPLSLMTNEEHERHAKESSDRRLQSTRALDAAKVIIRRCCQELSKVGTDDAHPSVERQAVTSNAAPSLKRTSATDVGGHDRSPTAVRPKSGLQAVMARANELIGSELYNLNPGSDAPTPPKLSKSATSRR
ncbi:tripartite motif protein [Aphelenchoides avenae]|nr:tripartite motif protein [Aphelenchus avenae]